MIHSSGLRVANVLLCKGAAPKNWQYAYHIHDPPNGGRTLMLVLPDDQGHAEMPWDLPEQCGECSLSVTECSCECEECGENRVEGCLCLCDKCETALGGGCKCPYVPRRHVLLHPFSLMAWSVPDTCGELMTAQRPRPEATPERLGEKVSSYWAKCKGRGSEKADFAAAASVLKMLGMDVPMLPPKEGEESKTRRSGKGVSDERLSKIKAGTRRAKLVELLRDGPKSIHELMSSMRATRSSVLSHLHTMNKANGLGYEVRGDQISVLIPIGWDPIDEA